MRLPLPAKNKLLIIYKLLADLLFLLLVFFTAALVADSLISGLISSHISFLKIFTLLTFNLIALYAVGAAARVKLTQDHPNKKTTTFLTVLAVLIVSNGLFKLNLYLNLFILAIAALCAFYLYKLFFQKIM